jgi:radical SAM protein with 4Fe4S-binding SPASM domain
MRRHERVRLPVVAQLPTPARRVIDVPAPGERPKPAMAVWELTLACDQGCLHCGPSAGAPRRGELDTDEAIALVGDLARIGVKEVVLIGGEAYLREDCPAIIRAIREHGMSAMITTGGYNVDAKLAALLVEAGLVSVSVSIDGLAATHDRLRARKDSFARAFAALGHFRAVGIRPSVNSQINALTLPDLVPLFERLVPERIDAWQLQITAPHGRAAENAEIILQPHMMLEAFAAIDRILLLADRHGIRIWAGNNLGYFGPEESRLRRQVKPRTLHFGGCEAGQNVLGIESDGRIKSCASLGGDDHSAGGWRDRDLAELWRASPQLLHLGARTRDDLWGYCRGCYYAEPCLGGCPAVAEPLLGRPGNNPFCHHRALEMDRAGWRERVEMVEAAPRVGFGAGRFRIVRETKDAPHTVVAIDEWLG